MLDLVNNFSRSETPKLVRKQPTSLLHFVCSHRLLNSLGTREVQKAPAEALNLHPSKAVNLSGREIRVYKAREHMSKVNIIYTLVISVFS